jgi:hypothetical protein
MDELGFRQFLKRAGKKEHVIDGLIKQVRACKTGLAKAHRAGFNSVTAQDIADYAGTLDEGQIKERMRGLALYFRFVGNARLARAASNIREKKIAKTRPSFKMGDFVGVNPENITKLNAAGIVTVDQMLAAGKTRRDREQLARKTHVPSKAILEMVKLSDLSRLGAVKSVRARLYYAAGLDTPDKFTHWEMQPLRQKLIEFVARVGFDGIAPLPKELENTIAKAKRLPKLVEY